VGEVRQGRLDEGGFKSRNSVLCMGRWLAHVILV